MGRIASKKFSPPKALEGAKEYSEEQRRSMPLARHKGLEASSAPSGDRRQQKAAICVSPGESLVFALIPEPRILNPV